MEKLIESRGQYDELRYKVGEELRTIQNVKDLLGGDCIKEEYNKYIKALHALKRVFVFSVEEKEEAFDEVLNDIKDKLTASATAEEYARHKKEETTDQLSENDLKRLAKIIQSRPIIAEIKLNEKTIAKEIIDPIQEGLDKQKKLRNMIGGVKE